MAYEEQRIRSGVSQRLAAHRASEMGGGTIAAVPKVSTQSTRPIAAAPAAPATAMVSALALRLAVQASVAAERNAMATLLEDPGASGRVKVIAALLDDGTGPAQIKALLEAGKLPSDRSIADKLAARRNEVNGDVWAQAIATQQEAIGGRAAR